MAKKEDGEFELVLGNRQLLSVFFIVVILVAVFFTMGYIVGRNSTPGLEARKSERPPAAEPLRPSAAGPAVAQRPATEQKSDSGGEPAAGPSPVKESDRPPAAKNEPEKAPEPTEAAAAVPEEPAPGQTYLQVVAVERAEAEIFVDVLGKKGFHAIFAPVPEKPGTFRVLVGPYKDAAAIGQARTDLEKAGFKNTFVRKY
jgi:cell division septation protein DedD